VALTIKEIISAVLGALELWPDAQEYVIKGAKDKGLLAASDREKR
jgi:hypothetical protein